jgi:hypothetical protein
MHTHRSGVHSILSVFIFHCGLGQVLLLAGCLISLALLPATAAAQTNVGSVDIGSSTTTTVTLTIPAAATLETIEVLTKGAPNLDFTNAGGGTCAVGKAYAAGATCTVKVNFAPKYAGTRYGAVVLEDGSANVIANGYLQGAGSGPQLTFSPNTRTTFGSVSGWSLGIAVDGNRNVFVADASSQTVYEIEVEGGYTTTREIAGPSSPFFLHTPGNLALDGAGNLFVADYGRPGVLEFPAAGGYTTVKVLGSGFVGPAGVAVDGSGNLFVADAGDNMVKEIPAAGGYASVDVIGSGFDSPEGVAVDAGGNVFFVDYSSVVKEIVAAGGYKTVNILGPYIESPTCLAVDGMGNVLVVDEENRTVEEIEAVGGYTAVDWLGAFTFPQALAVDGSGNVFVADWKNFVKLDLADSAGVSFPTPTPPGYLDWLDGDKTVVVSNRGTEPLIFAAPATGSNPSYPASFLEIWAEGSLCKAGTPLASGASCDVSMWFEPAGSGVISGNVVMTDNNLNQTDATQSIPLNGIGGLVVPAITWAAPAGITYGTPLSAKQLNASDSLAGTFAYSPAAGTVLPAGSQTLSVTFTPTDKKDYSPITASISLMVNPAALTVTANNVSSPYGAVPLLTYALSGFVNGDKPGVVSGAAAMTTTATISSPAGTYPIVPAQGTLSAANYTFTFVNGTLTVTQATQKITFPAVAAQIAGTDVDLAALASSNSGLTLGFASLTPSVCKVSGPLASLLAAGSCTIQATQTGNVDYLAAAAVTQTFTVGPATQTGHQTVTFPPIGTQMAATTVNLKATASSGLPVAFVSLTPSVCTVSGTTAALIAYGFCTIQAWQGGNSQYYATPVASQEFGVAHAHQTVDFPAIGIWFAGMTVNLVATASSGLPVTFTSTTPAVCTVSGSTAMLNAYGFCRVVATQAGNGEYLEAVASQEFGVGHAQ